MQSEDHDEASFMLHLCTPVTVLLQLLCRYGPGTTLLLHRALRSTLAILLKTKVKPRVQPTATKGGSFTEAYLAYISLTLAYM